MKIIVASLLLSGCAILGKNPHQYCISPEAKNEFASYDQCYAERSALRERQRKAFAPDPPKQQSTCTTTGHGNTVTTTCN